MKKNKPTYITDLTPETIADKSLLTQWSEKSTDMEFLELSVEILHDHDLLKKWSYDNKMEINLYTWLYDVKDDFTIADLKNKSNFKNYFDSGSYKEIIKRLTDSHKTLKIIKNDKLKSGISIEEIEIEDRHLKANNLLAFIEAIKGNSQEINQLLFKRIMPNKLNENKALEDKYFDKKGKEIFGSPINVLESDPQYLNNKIPNETNPNTTNLNDQKLKTNPYPLLFINYDVYECFLNYQKHIIDYYIDFSYLKKRLDDKKLIYYHKDNDFMKIVYESLKLLNNKDYENYKIKGKLDSLKRTSSAQRENNFNNIFETVMV